LVTGGTGFVGSHTVELLLQRGFTVRCFARYSRPDLGWIRNLPIEIVRGSYYSIDSLKPALKDVDYVLHIAGVTKARKASEYHDGNVLATKNLLEASLSAPQLKKFTFVSSLTAAGPSPDGTPLTEESTSVPITTYGVSKLEAETVCQLYATKVPLTILRPPAVYGPRDSDILQILQLVAKGIKPEFGSHKKHLSVIYGPELARGILEGTLSERTTGETYYVSDPSPYSLSDAVDVAARIMERKAFRLRFPSSLLYALAGISEFVTLLSTRPPALNIEKVRDLLQPHWTCSPAKFKEHTGFETRIGLEEGLRQTISWYKESGWL